MLVVCHCLQSTEGLTINGRALLASQRWRPLNRKQCFFDGTLNGELQAVAHTKLKNVLVASIARCLVQCSATI